MGYKNSLTMAFIASFIIAMPLVFAHTGETSGTGHSEEAGLFHQFEEILPFHHFAEGHVFAGITLILLWASLFFTIYSLFQLPRKKK